MQKFPKGMSLKAIDVYSISGDQVSADLGIVTQAKKIGEKIQKYSRKVFAKKTALSRTAQFLFSFSVSNKRLNKIPAYGQSNRFKHI